MINRPKQLCRRPIAFVAASIVLTSVAMVHADPNVEQLRKLYDEALAQLRDAQDRKNELAQENERLRERIAALELPERLMPSAEWHQRMNRLAAMEWFLGMHPIVAEKFNEFARANLLNTTAPAGNWYDPNWPFSAAERPQ
jgi:uncharacterized protein YlxW (UPF0749 family)